MEKATVVPMICQQMTDPKGTPLEFVRTATMTRRFSARNPKNRKPKPPFLVEYSQPQATGVFDGRMFLFLSDLFEETECWIAAQAIRLHGGELTVEPHKNVDFILLPTNEQQIDGTLRNRVYVQFMTLPFVTTHWVRLCVRERTLEPLTNGGCWAEGLSGGAKYVVLHDLVVCMRREKHAFINKQDAYKDSFATLFENISTVNSTIVQQVTTQTPPSPACTPTPAPTPPPISPPVSPPFVPTSRIGHWADVSDSGCPSDDDSMIFQWVQENNVEQVENADQVKNAEQTQHVEQVEHIENIEHVEQLDHSDTETGIETSSQQSSTTAAPDDDVSSLDLDEAAIPSLTSAPPQDSSTESHTPVASSEPAPASAVISEDPEPWELDTQPSTPQESTAPLPVEGQQEPPPATMNSPSAKSSSSSKSSSSAKSSSSFSASAASTHSAAPKHKYPRKTKKQKRAEQKANKAAKAGALQLQLQDPAVQPVDAGEPVMEEPPEEPTTVHVTVVEPAAKAPTGEEAALNEVAVQELIEEQPPVEQPLEQPTIVEATNEEPTTEEPTIEVTPALSPLPALEQDMGGSPATEVLQTPSQPASSGTCHSCPACGTIPLSGTAAARTLSSLHFLPNGQGYSITTLPSGAILLVPVAQQEVATSAATGADIAEPVSASASVVDSRGTDTEMIPPFYVHAPLPAPASPAAGSAIGSAIGSLENMVSALGLFLGNSLSVAQAQPATEAAAEPTAVVNGNASEGGDGEDEADAGDTADAGDAEATKKQKKNRKRNQTRKKAEKVAQAQAQAAAQAQAQSQAQQALVQANVQTQGPIQIPPGGIYLTCGGVPMGIDPHDPRLRELYESYVKLEASTAEMKVWTDEMRRNRELREATALLRLPAPTPSEIWSA